MSISLIKRGAVQALFEDIPKNLDRYLTGDFFDLPIADHILKIPGTSVDETILAGLEGGGGSSHDAKNSLIIFNALAGMTPYNARDERIWVYFSHFPCLEFSRKRWLDPQSSKEHLIKNIKAHFFARIGGNRAFERNNAISSLWWWACIASRYEDAQIDKTLEAFLTHTDVRTSIIERPTISQSPAVFSAIMKAVFKRMYDEPNPEFFKRQKNRGMYREWMKLINRNGGVRLYDGRPPQDVSDLVEQLAVEAEKSFLQ